MKQIVVWFLSLFAALSVAAQSFSQTKLPDGGIAKISDGEIKSAYFGCPTNRYQHGILGDAIEAGCLVVTGSNGDKTQLNLPKTRVFEDVTPRLHDLDKDGTAEIIVIESDNNKGAALSIYTLQDNELVLWARTNFIGRSNRWLAPVGVADFTYDGQLEIALVRTPHIGGVLELYRVGNKKLTKITSRRGYSNHKIGSNRVTTSKMADFDNDGSIDIALPDQSWRETVLISLKDGIKEIERRPYTDSFFN